MIINSLFLQNAEGSGGAMNALGMQKTNTAGYLFSDIIKVHLGSEESTDAGLSQSITGESELFSSGDVSSLMALIQNLSGSTELSEELKTMLEENNLLIGETVVTEEELENILAQLINQPNTTVFGINPNSEEPVKLADLEELKKYLAENDELLINAGDGTKSLKIDLNLLGKAENIIPINKEVGNDSEPKKFQVTFNYEKIEKPETQINGNSETMQSLEKLSQGGKNTVAEVASEKNVNDSKIEVSVDPQTTGKAKIINIETAANPKSSETKVVENVDAQTKQNVDVETDSDETLLTKEKTESNTSKQNVAKTDAETKVEKPVPEVKQSQETKTTNSSKEKNVEKAMIADSQHPNEEVEIEETENGLQKESKVKSAKVKTDVNPKVSEETETKPETKIKADSVNVSAKKSVKSENLNINGKPIVTHAESKPEVKAEMNTAVNNASNSEIASSLSSESDTTNSNFTENSKSDLNSFKNSGQEVHSSTKFSDMVNEKINKEQFLVRPEASRIVKAAELVKEIARHIQSQEKNSLTIHLEPEHLGKVKILMEVTDKVVKAHIEVDNEVAKHMVETNIKELHASSQKSGLELSQVNISLSNAEQKNHKQFADKKKGADEKSQKLSDSDFIEEKENQQIKNLGYNTVEYVA